MQRRRAITILLLSVAARSLWSLDANPLLFIYDIYVTTTRCSIAGFGGGNGGIDEGGDGDDDGRGRGSNSRRRRRVFPPGTVPTLEGKTVWITGASSGIGAELAIQLAHAGVGHLVLSGRTRRGRIRGLASRVRVVLLLGGEWRDRRASSQRRTVPMRSRPRDRPRRTGPRADADQLRIAGIALPEADTR